MHLKAIIDRLDHFPALMRSCVDAVSTQDLHWVPPHGGWSVAMITAHLLVEERVDFRPRLQRLLDDPSLEWDPIDPEKDVLGIDTSDVGALVDAFTAERRDSVQWLSTLEATQLQAVKTHPRFGDMHAGELLGAWIAHDALHLRQYARRLHELAVRDAAPWNVDYAGEW